MFKEEEVLIMKIDWYIKKNDKFFACHFSLYFEVY